MNKNDGNNSRKNTSSYDEYKYATLKVASDTSSSSSEDEEHGKGTCRGGKKKKIIEKQPNGIHKTNNNGKLSDPLGLTDFTGLHENQNGDIKHNGDIKQNDRTINDGISDESSQRTTTLWSKIWNFFTCGQTLFWGELFFPDYKFFEVNNSYN